MVCFIGMEAGGEEEDGLVSGAEFGGGEFLETMAVSENVPELGGSLFM